MFNLRKRERERGKKDKLVRVLAAYSCSDTHIKKKKNILVHGTQGNYKRIKAILRHSLID